LELYSLLSMFVDLLPPDSDRTVVAVVTNLNGKLHLHAKTFAPTFHSRVVPSSKSRVGEQMFGSVGFRIFQRARWMRTQPAGRVVPPDSPGRFACDASLWCRPGLGQVE